MFREISVDDELIEKALAYVKGGYASTEFEEVVPTVSGLAIHLGRNKRVMYYWRGKHPEFAEVLEMLHDYQHVVALTKACKKEISERIGEKILGNHGYSNTTKTEISGSLNVSDMTDEEIDSRIRQLVEK